MTCLTPEQFGEMLDAGRLDRPEPDVARHLAACPACRDAWASVGAAADVLPALRPARRGPAWAWPAVAAALLLVLLGSLLRVGVQPPSRPGSSVPLQEAEKELQTLVERLKSEDLEARAQAEAALAELVEKVGRDGLGWLREQERRASEPELKGRLAAVVGRLLKPQVLWSAVLEGAAFNAMAPAVDGRLCAFPSNSLTALDPATGKLLWKTAGYDRARPALTDAALFAPLSREEGNGFQALRPGTGERLWVHPIDDLWEEHAEGRHHDVALVASGRLLYTGTRAGRLVCVDAATGARRWATPPREAGSNLFNPAVRDGRVYLPEWTRALLAFDAETGRRLWEVPVPGIGTEAPVLLRDRVVVVTHDLGQGKREEERGECLAFSALTGGLLWKTDLAPFGKGAVGLIDAGPALVAQAKTHLVGLSPDDGAVLWAIPCPRFAYSSLARDERGRVYAGSDDGHLLVVDPGSGKLLLRVDLNALPQAEGAPKVSYGGGQRAPDLGTAGCPTVRGRDVFLMSSSGLALALRMSLFLGE